MKCIHCDGTGFCKHSVLKYSQRSAQLWYECKKCGKSNIGSYMWVYNPKPNGSDIIKANLNDIYCEICGGKGS